MKIVSVLAGEGSSGDVDAHDGKDDNSHGHACDNMVMEMLLMVSS